MTAITLHHVALWVRDLDEATRFWMEYFDAEVGVPYHSRRRPGFVSRFAVLPCGLRLELMVAPWVIGADGDRQGWDHLALSVGSRAAVEELATRCERSGHLLASPRETGDGFYEAIVAMPDGTRIEITA